MPYSSSEMELMEKITDHTAMGEMFEQINNHALEFSGQDCISDEEYEQVLAIFLKYAIDLKRKGYSSDDVILKIERKAKHLGKNVQRDFPILRRLFQDGSYQDENGW